jgi:hypothetical protein
MIFTIPDIQEMGFSTGSLHAIADKPKEPREKIIKRIILNENIY